MLGARRLHGLRTFTATIVINRGPYCKPASQSPCEMVQIAYTSTNVMKHLRSELVNTNPNTAQ